MLTFGGPDILSRDPSDAEQFCITIGNDGKLGQESFEIWLAVENNSGEDVEFDNGFATLWYHYGNWVAGLPIQPAELLPTKLLAAQKIRCRLQKGNRLPRPKPGNTAWLQADRPVAKLADYADFSSLMQASEIEIEASFQFQISSRKKHGFFSRWLPRSNAGRHGRKVLSVSCPLTDFETIPFYKASAEKCG